MISSSKSLWLCLLVVALVQGTRVSFELKGRLEECLIQQMDARSTANRMLFRYSILNPSTSDLIDVHIQSPTGKTLESWNQTQSEHSISTIRENGLYSFCFKKRASAKQRLRISFLLDFISTGSRTLTSYADHIGTVSTADPDNVDSKILHLQGASSFGVFDFDLHDISTGILHDNTRVMVQLSCDYAQEDHSEVTLHEFPEEDFVTPLSYTNLKAFITTRTSTTLTHPVDYGDAITGGGVLLDVTDEIEEALKTNRKSIAFLLQTEKDAPVKFFAMAHASPDHWPKLIFEDLGVETMHEIAYFKEYLFQLRGEVSYILQGERISRDAAESTNSRITWFAFLINAVLIGVAFGQITYVRHLLETN